MLFTWWTFYWVEIRLPFVYVVMHHLSFLTYWSGVYITISSIFVPYQGPLFDTCASVCDSIWKFGTIAVIGLALLIWIYYNSVNFNIFASMKQSDFYSYLISVNVMSVITGPCRACHLFCSVHYFCTFKQHGCSILHFRILTCYLHK